MCVRQAAASGTRRLTRFAATKPEPILPLRSFDDLTQETDNATSLSASFSPLAHHFFTMACNNAWANHRLLTACGRLSQDDFIATRTSFFPSIKATLNHNLTVDWYYVDALERALEGKPANRERIASSIRKSRTRSAPSSPPEQRAVDRRLIAACASLTDAALERRCR